MSGTSDRGEHGLLHDEASKMSNDQGNSGHAELTRLLEAWGGEPSRWPAHVSLRMAALAASVPGSDGMLAEARALDRLLDRVREAPAGLEAAAGLELTDRIMAAALASAALVDASRETQGTGGRVISFPARQPASAPLASTRRASPWQAAGLIAASLLVGVYLGGSFNMAPVLQEMAEAVGMSAVVDTSLVGDDLGEEDTL